MRQYADNTTLSLACKDACDLEEGLTRNVEVVARWVEENRLRLNVKKTQMLLLSRRGRRRELDSVKVMLPGQPLTRCGKVKCLGVWIDDCLTWRDHIADVRRKCFGALSKIQWLRDVLPVDTKKKLYDTFVLRHLDYCCVLWHECSKELQCRVDRIQNYRKRLILSKPSRTPSEGLRQELKWTHLSK